MKTNNRCLNCYSTNIRKVIVSEKETKFKCEHCKRVYVIKKKGTKKREIIPSLYHKNFVYC